MICLHDGDLKLNAIAWLSAAERGFSYVYTRIINIISSLLLLLLLQKLKDNRTVIKNAYLLRLCRYIFLNSAEWQQCQLYFFLGLLQKLSCEKPLSAAIFTAWRCWCKLRPRRALSTVPCLSNHTLHPLQIQMYTTKIIHTLHALNYY